MSWVSLLFAPEQARQDAAQRACNDVCTVATPDVAVQI
jgi:hypothetical protein